MTYLFRKAWKDFGPAEDKEQAHSREEEEKNGSYQGQLRRLLREQEEAAAWTWNVAATKHLELSPGSLAASEFRCSHPSAKRALIAEGCKNEQVTFELYLSI